MSVAISWANKMQLAKCDIMVGFPISSHIYVCTVVWEKFTVEYFRVKIVRVKIFSSSRVANEKIFNNELMLWSKIYCLQLTH